MNFLVLYSNPVVDVVNVDIKNVKKKIKLKINKKRTRNACFVHE